jgi:hypothetical protein
MPKATKTRKADKKAKGKMSKPKRYEIHDNGGVPFLVDDYGDHVVVYKQPYNLVTDERDPPTKLFEKKYSRIFIGDKPKWQRPETWRPEFKGNTILIETQPNTYVYIGSNIYEWKPEKGDTVVEYYSQMGNNDVPYPFAIGKTHAYFLIAGTQESMPLDYFDLKTSLYEQLWLDMSVNGCKHQPGRKGTDLCKRLKAGDPDLKAQLEYLIANRKPISHTILQKREF